MARRPRKSVPLSIDLKFNTANNLYEGEENGITYQLTFTQMNDLKHYFRGSNGFNPTITTWYNALDRFAKKEIKRLGVPEHPDGFFPDQEWPNI